MKMKIGKLGKRMVLKIIIVLAILVGVCYVLHDVLGYLVIRGFVFSTGRDVRQRQVRLLYKTDHQALLEACRELSGRVVRGDLKPGTYSIRRDPDPETSRFPQVILDLEPSYVYIDENNSGRVMLEMFGGLGHFGVQAYTEDYKKPHLCFEYGDKELIPGLWYYDDGYRRNPEHGKIIEALRPKGK